MQHYCPSRRASTPIVVGKNTPADLSGRVGISLNTVDALIKGETPIGVELSLRLARYFSTAPDFWVQLQLDHDMEQARHKMGEEIRLKITPRTA